MRETKILLSQRQALELADTNPNAVEMLLELALLWPEPVMEVSCIGRTWTEDKALGASGVHSDGPPWRAIDVRTRTLGPDDVMTEDDQRQADEMADTINARWLYDPARPDKQELISKKHGSGPHIHIQVHPRTRRARA